MQKTSVEDILLGGTIFGHVYMTSVFRLLIASARGRQNKPDHGEYELWLLNHWQVGTEEQWEGLLQKFYESNEPEEYAKTVALYELIPDTVSSVEIANNGDLTIGLSNSGKQLKVEGIARDPLYEYSWRLSRFKYSWDYFDAIECQPDGTLAL